MNGGLTEERVRRDIQQLKGRVDALEKLVGTLQAQASVETVDVDDASVVLPAVPYVNVTAFGASLPSIDAADITIVNDLANHVNEINKRLRESGVTRRA